MLNHILSNLRKTVPYTAIKLQQGRFFVVCFLTIYVKHKFGRRGPESDVRGSAAGVLFRPVDL